MGEHLVIIPDGNRRFSGNSSNNIYNIKNLMELGVKNIHEHIKYIVKNHLSINNITFHLISPENTKRPGILQYIEDHMEDFLNLIDKTLKINVNIFGDLSIFSEKFHNLMENRLKNFSGNTVNVNFFINYSMEKDLLYYYSYEKWLESPVGKLPPFDIIIRTGGHNRISGFCPLLIQYSEIYFTQELWPAFTIENLEFYLQKFYSRKCTFGL